jgi:hypothetical protein
MRGGGYIVSVYNLLGYFLAAAQLLAATALIVAMPSMIRNNTVREGILLLCISLATAIFIVRSLI